MGLRGKLIGFTQAWVHMLILLQVQPSIISLILFGMKTSTTILYYSRTRL